MRRKVAVPKKFKGRIYGSFLYLCKHKKLLGLMRDSDPRPPASQAPLPGLEICVNHWAKTRAHSLPNFHLKFIKFR